MPAERLRGTSIVWQFAITTFIVFGLIGVGIAALRAGELRASSEEAAQVRAELIAESVIAPLLGPAGSRRPGDRESATASSTGPSTSSRWKTPVSSG